MEDESQTENVTNGFILGLHILDVDHFWCHIARCSASHEEIFLGISELSQTKISYHTFPSALSSKDEVLWFEVSMHDPTRMHLSQALENTVND